MSFASRNVYVPVIPEGQDAELITSSTVSAHDGL